MNISGNDSELEALLNSDESDKEELKVEEGDGPKDASGKSSKSKLKTKIGLLRSDMIEAQNLKDNEDPDDIIETEKEKTYDLLIK